MKMHSNNLLEKLSKNEMELIASQVKETLAKTFTASQNRIFSAAELWNIHRQRKAFVKRRLSF